MQNSRILFLTIVDLGNTALNIFILLCTDFHTKRGGC